jgi:hypothetical protein
MGSAKTGMLVGAACVAACAGAFGSGRAAARRLAPVRRMEDARRVMLAIFPI